MDDKIGCRNKKKLCMPCHNNGTLFGRKAETNKLHEVKSRLFGGSDNSCCQAVWIHGVSGSGKTALARQLRRGDIIAPVSTARTTVSAATTKRRTQTSARQFYFIEGKYDQYQDCSTPYSGLVQAFHSLGEQVRLDSRQYQLKHSNIVLATSTSTPTSSTLVSPSVQPQGEKNENINKTDGGASEEDHEDPMFALDAALKNEGNVLLQIIPSLSINTTEGNKIVSSQQSSYRDASTTASVVGGETNDSSNKENGVEDENVPSSSLSVSKELNMATQRLAVAFSSFLREFCSSTRPVILFLDDLQWSDSNSLDVLAAILNDPEISHHFLFVGGYREEMKSNLENFLNGIDNQNLTTTDLQIHNMDTGAVHELVASTLSMELEDTEELADIVFHKTDGNPFFVLQFLDALARLKLLQYDFLRVQWVWNASSIRSDTDVADNVAEMVTQRLNSVPPDVRRLLQLASCLGFQIDRILLEKIYCSTTILELGDSLLYSKLENSKPEQYPASKETKTDHKNQFEQTTALAEEYALLESSGSLIKFSHDRIRQLSYELVSDREQRCRIHFALGSCILLNFGDSAASPYLLLATDQINRGVDSEFIHLNERDRLALIKLNLEASKVARQCSALILVYGFLSKAYSLVVGDKDWEESYDLVLDIHLRLYDLESYHGNFERAKKLFDEVIEHARQPSDKASAFSIRARSSAYTLRYSLAIKDARKALSLLGIHLKLPTKIAAFREHIRIKFLIRGMSDEDILNLPIMEDKKMVKATRILLMLVVYGFAESDQSTIALAFFKMLELTLKYGLSFASASGFAGYAQLLAQSRKHQEAYRFAELALEAEKDKETVAATRSLISSMCMHLKKPLASSMEPTLAGYRAGLQSGDLFFGSICLAKYLQMYVVCGLPLLPFASDCKNFAGQTKLLQWGANHSAYILPTLVLALNLTGQLSEPGRMTWEQGVELNIIDSSDLQVEAFEHSPVGLLMRYYRMLIGCVLNDTPLMAEVLKSIMMLKKKQRRFLGSHSSNYLFALLDGLCGFELYKKLKKYRFFQLARNALKELKCFHNLNTVPLVQFLEAEQASTDLDPSNKGMVKRLYDKAIISLARSGFTHYTAMAYERAGIFMLKHNDEYWAQEYLVASVQHFDEWGCSIKVEILNERYGNILARVDRTGQATSTGILGRKRFGSIASAQRNTERSLAVGRVVDSKSTAPSDGRY